MKLFQQISCPSLCFRGALATAGKWIQDRYQHTKEAVRYNLSGPEESFFTRTQGNGHFVCLQAWRYALEQDLREIRSAILSGEYNAVECGERLLAIQSLERMTNHILSPVVYSLQLTKLEQNLRTLAQQSQDTADINPTELLLTADVIQKVLRQLRTNLNTDSDLAEQYLLSDLLNATIFYASNLISKDGFASVLHYYQNLINARLHASLSYIIEALPANATDPNNPFDFIHTNCFVRTLFQYIDEVFKDCHEVQSIKSDFADDITIDMQTNTWPFRHVQWLNAWLKTAITVAGNLTQQGIQLIRENPKAVMTAATLGYLYYITHHDISTNTSQYHEITQPLQQSHLSLTSRTVELVTYSSFAYGMTVLMGSQLYGIPVVFVAGLSSLLKPTLAHSNPASFLKTIGGNANDQGRSVQITSDGGYITTGYTSSFGEGNQDLLLAKFTEIGMLDWATAFGGVNDEMGLSVQMTTNRGYVVTGFTGSYGAGSRDLLLAKFNESGALDWVRVFGGSSQDSGQSLQVTPDEGSVVAGYTASFGAGGTDLLLAKFCIVGMLSWARTLGGVVNDFGFSVQISSDNGYIVTGETYGFGASALDLLVAKFTTTGVLDWARTLTGSTGERGMAGYATPDGGCVVTGATESFGMGNYDLLLVKFNATGSSEWGKVLGGSNIDYGRFVQSTLDGGYIVTGYTQNFGAGFDDLLLAKFDAIGRLDWATMLGGNNYDDGYSVRSTADGGYIVVGFTDNFGEGQRDLLLAKFDANGTIANCSAVQSITPTVFGFTPPVKTITPTVQNISPVVQTWDITAISILPVLHAHCSTFYDTTSNPFLNTNTTGISTSTRSIITTPISVLHERSSTFFESSSNRDAIISALSAQYPPTSTSTIFYTQAHRTTSNFVSFSKQGTGTYIQSIQYASFSTAIFSHTQQHQATRVVASSEESGINRLFILVIALSSICGTGLFILLPIGYWGLRRKRYHEMQKMNALR